MQKKWGKGRLYFDTVAVLHNAAIGYGLSGDMRIDR